MVGNRTHEFPGSFPVSPSSTAVRPSSVEFVADHFTGSNPATVRVLPCVVEQETSVQTPFHEPLEKLEKVAC
jgi:hypothetical protein